MCVGSCQLTPALPESGLCLGDSVTFTCTQRIGRFNGVTYDFLAWDVGESSVTFVHGVDMSGATGELQPFQDNQMITFVATVESVTMNELQSTLRMMVPRELNGLVIRCQGESVYETSTINVTSKLNVTLDDIVA